MDRLDLSECSKHSRQEAAATGLETAPLGFPCFVGGVGLGSLAERGIHCCRGFGDSRCPLLPYCVVWE